MTLINSWVSFSEIIAWVVHRRLSSGTEITWCCLAPLSSIGIALFMFKRVKPCLLNPSGLILIPQVILLTTDCSHVFLNQSAQVEPAMRVSLMYWACTASGVIMIIDLIDIDWLELTRITKWAFLYDFHKTTASNPFPLWVYVFSCCLLDVKWICNSSPIFAPVAIMTCNSINWSQLILFS